MSYLEHFGLSSEPFSNAPVSRFYYDAPQHQQALKRLLYSVSSMKGLSVLVGEIGAGKTTLARRLLDSLPEEEYEAALLVIIHSGITASWLLRRIALQIGVENPAQEKLALLSQLYQRLLQIYEQGRKAVVLIDEAQMLETRELMEEFRGLLNLEVPERKLISFVFFGLPEIEKNLKLDPPLAQRVAMRYRLEPFTSESTAAYIKHRMRLAGASRNPFTEGAMEAVHRRSGGTPRVINTLCDNALFETFLDHGAEISEALIETIATNLGLEYGAVQPLAERPTAPAPPPVAPVSAPPEDEGMKITTPQAPPVVVAAPLVKPQPPPPPAVAKPAPPRPPAPALTKPVAPAVKPPPRPPMPPQVKPREEAAQARPSASPLSSAMASLTGEVIEGEALPEPGVESPESAPPPAPPATSKAGVDLAEIDRYLEGLGKL